MTSHYFQHPHPIFTAMPQLYGPFDQLIPLDHLPVRGALADEQLEVLSKAGILVEGEVNGGGKILAVGAFETLHQDYPEAWVQAVKTPSVCLPGLIDTHTHLCWAGSRAPDFALRNAGKSYLEMAAAGGGIRSSVRQTRAATDNDLVTHIQHRLHHLRAQGITTAECKSGYGLTVAEELRHLRLIAAAATQTSGIAVVPTCLAAHVCPPEFEGDPAAYLQHLTEELLPQLPKDVRVDAFAEPSTFWGQSLERYLEAARQHGFALTLHADQFTPGGAVLGAKLGALSVDHLENTDEASIAALAQGDKAPVAVALPGASLGLGEPYTPARKLLDAGACLAIASDWNPGSAPQGNLLGQATTLAAAQKLTNAEVLAGLTIRAARALGLTDRGILAPGMRADLSVWPTDDYRSITWHMGSLPATPHPFI